MIIRDQTNSGYDSACQVHGITRLGCWAHARRKFFDAAKLQPKGKTGRPDQALAMIGKLYQVEREPREPDPDERHPCATFSKNSRWPKPWTILTHYCRRRSSVGICRRLMCKSLNCL